MANNENKQVKNQGAERVNAAPAAPAIPPKPSSPIEKKTDQWQRLGVYVLDAETQIPSGDFLVYAWHADKRDVELGFYYKNGNIIPEAYGISDNEVVYNKKIYKRLFGPGSFERRSFDEIETARKFEDKNASTTRTHVFIGENLVFKTASTGSSLADCLPEVSRTLIVASKGFPHAIPYGIHTRQGQFYEVEEKLDMTSSDKLFTIAKSVFGAIRAKSIELRSDFLEAFFHLQQNDQLAEEQIKALQDYLRLFHEFKLKMQEFNIGGDFKLNNLALRMGDTNQLFATDFVLADRVDRFLPLRFTDWLRVANSEGGRDLFLNPYFRLEKFVVPKQGGSRKPRHKTQKRKHLKRKTRRSKN